MELLELDRAERLVRDGAEVEDLVDLVEVDASCRTTWCASTSVKMARQKRICGSSAAGRGNGRPPAAAAATTRSNEGLLEDQKHVASTPPPLHCHASAQDGTKAL